MKLLYIANIRLPTERAHGLQVMEMTSAIAKGGDDVELVVPRRRNTIAEDPFSYYGIDRDFRITRLPCVDLVKFGRIGYLLQLWTFSLFAIAYALKQKRVVYSRDEFILFLYSFFRRPYVFETHIGKWNPIVRTACRGALLILPITQGLSDFFSRKGVSREKMVVAPDGVDLARFEGLPSRDEARDRLSLPKDKRIALYAGHLYTRKGAQVLAEAAKGFPDDMIAVFVGGAAGDVEEFRSRYGADPHVSILGHRPHATIPLYLRAADVLILPNSAKSDDSRLYTSPMKLFEYMASGTPIVASDVPSLREVLTEEHATFFAPDDPTALRRAIAKRSSDGEREEGMGRTARATVQRYGWSARAASVLKEANSRIEGEKTADCSKRDPLL